ncbi:hypothetical protein GCM10023189_06780 [Nibrella saemangeumensis]|uniref:Uncharacterized protein n=2 Tax=Nibrella saemangeumensis TaxID=1084526 RepID=A0ABP8MFK0_9BACT
MVIALMIIGKLTGGQSLTMGLSTQMESVIALKSAAACKPSLFSNRGFIPHSNRHSCQRADAHKQTLVGKGIRLVLGDVKS